MGNRNVRALILAQPPITNVSPSAFRVLLIMAATAHDDDPKYWAGISHLVLNLPPQKPGTGRRTVMRHISALQDAGYVFRTDKRKGHRTVYELRIPHLGQ